MAFEKTLLGTRFTNLHHLSSDMAKYERAKATRAPVLTVIHKGPYYREVVEISAQQTNETDSDSTDEEEFE